MLATQPMHRMWQLIETWKKLFLVGFAVLISPGSIEQLVIAFMFALIYMLLTSVVRPYKSRGDDYFAQACSFGLVAVFFFSIILKLGVLTSEVHDVLSLQTHNSFGFDVGMVTVGLVASTTGALVLAAAMVMHDLTVAARAAARVAAAERAAAAARGRMSHPPFCDWQLDRGHTYCVFLSHYKVEAGSDARYLSDLIRRMTGCPAYLDSTDLVDLRTLFNEGVHRTDVLVILATKGVLTRPWCLLEMWEAALKQVPIVLFPVVGGGWTQADARVLLGDLMGQMQDYNPTCMAEVASPSTIITTPQPSPPPPQPSSSQS